MPQTLHLTTPSGYSGTLTFSRAPAGELTFEDGVATVADDVDVDRLCDRYPNLEPLREGDPDPTAADPPLLPGDYNVRELRETLAESEYSDDELRAIYDREMNGDERATALDAIRASIDDADAGAEN